MIKFDERFREAIESGRKTHTFRTSQKGIPGTVEPIVYVSPGTSKHTVKTVPDGYVRIINATVDLTANRDKEQEGFSDHQQMLQWFEDHLGLGGWDYGIDHEFEYIGKTPTEEPTT